VYWKILRSVTSSVAAAYTLLRDLTTLDRALEMLYATLASARYAPAGGTHPQGRNTVFKEET